MAYTSAFSTPASTALFRRLTWEGTVPLEIRVDSMELPANSDRGLECYYVQAPRVSYLPLLVPEIKRFLADIVFDATATKSMREEEWWFETEDRLVMKWCVERYINAPSQFDDFVLFYRHWSIGLLYDYHTITSSAKKRPNPDAPITPLQLILHLAAPPTDKLLLSPSIEACKQAFMGQLKEADFLRWGNTKRMTGLRGAEQDSMWEGIKERKLFVVSSVQSNNPYTYVWIAIDNFDNYWRIASKVIPTATPAHPISPPPTSVSGLARPPSADPNGTSDKDGAYNVRSVPVRIYFCSSFV